VWRRLCFDDVSRFFVLSVFVFGLVFSQMEEPGYMLYVTLIIALQWQEHRYQKPVFANEKLIKSTNLDF
jgi:acyl dehydratase